MNQAEVVEDAKKFCASKPQDEPGKVRTYHRWDKDKAQEIPYETQGIRHVEATGNYTNRALAKLRGVPAHTEFVAACKTDGTIRVDSMDGPGIENIVSGLKFNQDRVPLHQVTYTISKDGKVTRKILHNTPDALRVL